MSKTIELTKGFLTIVDDEDYLYINRYKWHTHMGHRKGVRYAARQTQKDNVRRTIYMHQAIIERIRVIVPKGYRIKHEDGDGLNNRRNNLKVRK